MVYVILIKCSKSRAPNTEATFFMTVSIPLFSQPHSHHFLPKAPLVNEFSFRYLREK